MKEVALDLFGSSLTVTFLMTAIYVTVRLRDVSDRSHHRQVQTEEAESGVRRVTRPDASYNASAAQRDYWIRRHAVRWVIVPGLCVGAAAGIVYLLLD